MKNHRDALTNLLHAVFTEIGNLPALDLDQARIRLEEAHENAQRNGLAHTAAAENAERLPAVD